MRPPKGEWRQERSDQRHRDMATGTITKPKQNYTGSFSTSALMAGYTGNINFRMYGEITIFYGNFYRSSAVSQNTADVLIPQSSLLGHSVKDVCTGVFIGYANGCCGNVSTDGYNITITPREGSLPANTYCFIFGICGLS